MIENRVYWISKTREIKSENYLFWIKMQSNSKFYTLYRVVSSSCIDFFVWKRFSMTKEVFISYEYICTHNIKTRFEQLLKKKDHKRQRVNCFNVLYHWNTLYFPYSISKIIYLPQFKMCAIDSNRILINNFNSYFLPLKHGTFYRLNQTRS